MTQEQIVVSNKMIRKFMGHDHMSVRLQYDSSWNDLMPVVEKIEGEKYYIGIDRNFCMIGELPYITSPESVIPTIKGDSKIDAVYKQCIQFIEYYNRKSSNQ